MLLSFINRFIHFFFPFDFIPEDSLETTPLNGHTTWFHLNTLCYVSILKKCLHKLVLLEVGYELYLSKIALDKLFSQKNNT